MWSIRAKIPLHPCRPLLYSISTDPPLPPTPTQEIASRQTITTMPLELLTQDLYTITESTIDNPQSVGRPSHDSAHVAGNFMMNSPNYELILNPILKYFHSYIPITGNLSFKFPDMEIGDDNNISLWQTASEVNPTNPTVDEWDCSNWAHRA